MLLMGKNALGLRGVDQKLTLARKTSAWWWTRGADLEFDFLRGRYHGGTPSLIRSTSALMADAAGSYQSFAPNVLARIDGQGAQVAPARTNKCANFNANPVDLTGVVLVSADPAATLTLVDDVAALASAGLAGICPGGKVYKLDNSAGVAASQAQFTGLAGNTNLHTVSFYARGTGRARPRFGSTTTGAIFSDLGASYSGLAYTVAPMSNESARIQVEPGTVVYFILNQLEEGSFASPPIITTGAAASRAGDMLTADLTGKLANGVAGFIKVDIRQPSLPSLFSEILRFSGGAGANRVTMYESGAGQLSLSADTSGVGQGVVALGAWAQGIQTIAFAAGPNFLVGRRVGGTLPTADTTVNFPVVDRLGLLGRGTDTSANTYGFNQKLALFYGSPSKPINQAFFDEVYAKALAA